MSSTINKSDKPIFVTTPLMPDYEEFVEMIKPLWSSKILTNNGEFVQRLEGAIGDYLGEKYVSLYANGTLPIMAACKALELKGDVITTPYTFIATSHALKWCGLQPVYVDIDPLTGNLDPSKIENAITERTCAILPVHVYGNPCDVATIDAIAKRYDIPVIYDAAHAFGVRLGRKSITSFGDIVTMSFHATKVFNTIEGGAVICRDEMHKKQLDYLRNFGFESETEIAAVGINAKIDEMRAAFGLLNLKQVATAINLRREISSLYNTYLKGVPGISFFSQNQEATYNFSHYPILLDDKSVRDDVYETLKKYSIFSRRYFYPLVTEFKPYCDAPGASNVMEAKNISERVLCLPLSADLNEVEAKNICYIIVQRLSDIHWATH